MSFRETSFYTKNKASKAFSRDSNYEFDFYADKRNKS